LRRVTHTTWQRQPRWSGRRSGVLVVVISSFLVARAAVAAEPGAASQPADSRLIGDFEGSLQAAPGGWFTVIGGRPDCVRDQLTTLGRPSAGAWRIDVTNQAPQRGAGGLIPLYNQLQRGAKPLDVAATPLLELRLIGELGQRTLRIAVCPDAIDELERAATDLRTLSAADVDAAAWKDFVLPLRGDAGPLRTAGVVRLLLEGEGPAWIAVDRIRLGAAEPLPAYVQPEPTPAHALRKALWVWTTDEIYPNAKQRSDLLAYAKKHAYTDLFCQMRYTYEGGTLQLQLVDEQRAFLAAAHAAGLTIHALDGHRDYVLPENHARMLTLVETLAAFNAAGPADARYDAVHLDNEPYLLKGWNDAAERQRIVNAFVDLNRQLKQRCTAAGLSFGLDIPFWFDRPDYVYTGGDGQTQLLEAIFRTVDNLGIMSYRERATGPNGVVAVCTDEFALGRRYKVAVFPSLETGTGPDVEKGITLGVYASDYYHAQLATLQRVLRSEPACGGIAIHYYHPVLFKLEDQP